MKRSILSLTLLFVLFVMPSKAQPFQRQSPYNLLKDRVLYTIGYAHLDTEWNWDYPATINDHIKQTMEQNFRLFELYPDYVFNFTGSRRYNMMKEYYPDLFKKVQYYVKGGRWYVSGSSVDEGEVNITSSESLIRQILYGNEFFKKEFGEESYDYMLPDCFGFLCNLPTIFHYCGLLGFSTQKLTWHSAVGVPFNVGVWNGPDGKGIVAALNATSYAGHVENRLDKDKKWIDRLDTDRANTGYAFDYRYYGVGDEGGAPRENDVKRVVESLHNQDSNFKVLLTSSDQMFKDITPEIRKHLPVYSGDLLLTEHSAGSMTSQAYMKRMNRKNELLAQSAEQMAVAANYLNGAVYPKEKIDKSWDLVLGSQFHDILPGTSIPKAYEYAWNDEFIAANGFAETLKHGVAEITGRLNTKSEGRSIVVYNSVATNRNDIVTAELTYPELPKSISVFDKDGKEVPSQIIAREGNKLKFIFEATVPSVGLVVYDVRENVSSINRTALKVTSNSLENAYYKVQFLPNGDIAGIWDKKASKQLLSKPAGLEFQMECPSQYPAWNMDWNDRKEKPIGRMDEDAELKILENGPVRVALQVKRKGRNSEIIQTYSLSVGEAGKRLEVANKLNWQSREVSLKAAFPLNVSNENATYNLGVGTIARNNNNEKKFEVPSKEWFDLTDKSGKYGVSILEDCKYGSDKPDNNTLRLTLLYTPAINKSNKRYIYQSTQDWGIHDFKYAIYGHKGDYNMAKTPWQAKFLNEPLLAFESQKHEGTIGKTFSMLTVNNPNVGVMALKKMEEDNYYLIRVNELSGKNQKHIKVVFPAKVLDAYEVNGQEKKIGGASITGNTIDFDLSHYTIRSFAVRLQSAYTDKNSLIQQRVLLPYNIDVISYDTNRDDGNFSKNQSIPAELVPDTIESEGVRFVMGNKADGENNAVICGGQTIQLPQGDYSKLYLLAASKQDTEAPFIIDNDSLKLHIQSWTGYVGEFYNRILSRDQNSVVEMESPFAKTDNIAWFASHVHNSYPSHNEAYQYCYLYKYEISLPKGARTITFPDNKQINILALTIAKPDAEKVVSLQPLYDNFKDNQKFVLRSE